jgi:hypothetical protein
VFRLPHHGRLAAGGDLSPLDLMTRRFREWQEGRRLHTAILQLEKEEK